MALADVNNPNSTVELVSCYECGGVTYAAATKRLAAGG